MWPSNPTDPIHRPPSSDEVDYYRKLMKYYRYYNKSYREFIGLLKRHASDESGAVKGMSAKRLLQLIEFDVKLVNSWDMRPYCVRTHNLNNPACIPHDYRNKGWR